MSFDPHAVPEPDAHAKGFFYTAPPTLAAFMKSEAFFRLVAGPIGSGKTTGCMAEIFRRAVQQDKAPDGYRYTKFAIVRDTLINLKQTIKSDIEMWLQSVADFRVSENKFYLNFADVRSEWQLMPLEDLSDQNRLLSAQLTGIWMSECIQMDSNLIEPLMGRCGRYPSAELGECTWKGIIADTNFPTDGSDWYKVMENPSATMQIFKQPSGLAPNAENLNHLNQTAATRKLPIDHPTRIAQGRIYYTRLVTDRNQDWIKRYVKAEYGTDPSGTAVFASTFSKAFHVVPELEPVASRLLLVGQDFGRNPWSLICQMDHKGRLLVLQEVAGTTEDGDGVGLEKHLKYNLRPAVTDYRYAGRPLAVVGDPSGGAKSSLYEINEFDMLKEHGFAAFPAPTNNIEPRLQAVEKLLLQQHDGGPALVIDAARCPQLVKALNGGYRFAKMKSGESRGVPDKGPSSHVADCLEYVCLCIERRMYQHVLGRVMSNNKPRRVPMEHIRASAWT